MYNLELPSHNKQNLSERRTLEGYLDLTQVVTWPTFNCYTACQGCPLFYLYLNFMRLCLIHNSDLNCKMKNWKYKSGFLSKFWKVNQISLEVNNLWAIIQSKSKSNPRELQFMIFLLALAYHDRATFETFRQLELLHHQPLNSFFWYNMVGGSITLWIQSEATKSQPLKIQPCEFIVKSFDRPEVLVYRTILKLYWIENFTLL